MGCSALIRIMIKMHACMKIPGRLVQRRACAFLTIRSARRCSVKRSLIRRSNTRRWIASRQSECCIASAKRPWPSARPWCIRSVVRVVCRGSAVLPHSGIRCRYQCPRIAYWWCHERPLYFPRATELLILADCGGANSARARVFKWRLHHQLCQPHQVTVTLCHYPPGASKPKFHQVRDVFYWFPEG